MTILNGMRILLGFDVIVEVCKVKVHNISFQLVRTRQK